GMDIGDVQLSPNGEQVVYVLGNPANENGETANPALLQTTTEQAIYVVNSTGGEPRKISSGNAPRISPHGNLLAFILGKQVWLASLTDTAAKPQKLFQSRGGQSNIQWSPKSNAIAFVSNRGDHSFIGVYQLDTKTVQFVETSIDLDADILEMIAKEFSRVGKGLGVEKKSDPDTLIRITQYQELTMMLRQNLLDKQRMVNAMLRSEHFPADCHDRLRMMIKDVNSLIDHTSFSFDRLEYLQDTFLGLINIEQNKVIKIFTVASVIFLPPTLIASWYGMNFDILPELHWKYGYLFAIAAMISSSLVTLWFFRRKGWL
ncbi:MAG: hypothetical protein LH473_04975, partial [Chitinophagales bacterium]|nr:hypothetical protein [Chitinophagales bacterium]